jgi:SNF2 family DNA or RNA helicase
MEALLRLASDERIKELEIMLLQQVKLASGDDDDDEVLETSEDIDIPTMEDWEEGTEDLKCKSMDELWCMIGLGEKKHIPGLNERIDIDGAHNPWVKEDEEWFKNPANGVEFELQHHQLTGIVRLTEMSFKDGMHGLLADEVGLGKGVQIMGHICVIRFFREYYGAKGTFPGDFGTYRVMIYILIAYSRC